MASWMVHLRIAENLLPEFPSLEPAIFAVGNIAPDSGIPDANWENFDPPYTLTHFCDFGLFVNSRDLEFFHNYLELCYHAMDEERNSFLWGYFCHLVTDNLWNVIRRSTYDKIRDQFDGDRNFVWEVKRDWYGLDHLYASENPDCLYWRVFMKCQYRTDCIDIIPQAALTQRVDYIRKEYQPDEEKLAILKKPPFEFLNKQQMDEFIAVSSVKIAAWMHRLQKGDPAFRALEFVTQIKEYRCLFQRDLFGAQHQLPTRLKGLHLKMARD